MTFSESKGEKVESRTAEEKSLGLDSVTWGSEVGKGNPSTKKRRGEH